MSERKNYIRGGTSYPPVYEVVVQGKTVWTGNSYAFALAAFRKHRKHCKPVYEVVVQGKTVWTGNSYAFALAAFRKHCKPVYEVVVQGKTVWTGNSYAFALAAFRKHRKARGLRVPKTALVNE